MIIGSRTQCYYLSRQISEFYVPIARDDVTINPVRFPDSTTETILAEFESRVPAVVRFIVFASEIVLGCDVSRKSTNPPTTVMMRSRAGNTRSFFGPHDEVRK